MYSYPEQKISSYLNLNLKIQFWTLKFELKFGGRTTLTSLITVTS
jgi:hypothetical protein